MTYEEICKTLSRHNMEVFETIETQMQDLDPSDLSKADFKRVTKMYERFCNSGNLDSLAGVARILNTITDCGLVVEK